MLVESRYCLQGACPLGNATLDQHPRIGSDAATRTLAQVRGRYQVQYRLPAGSRTAAQSCHSAAHLRALSASGASLTNLHWQSRSQAAFQEIAVVQPLGSA